jgi:methyltransferase (TIGR00027 family)
MKEAKGLIHSIQDTARWAAVFRARESSRHDALFRDPLAERLAGPVGFRIADEIPGGNANTWAWVTRTYLFDQVIAARIASGVDLVIELAAGLSARAYRMDLPPRLRWVEVDLPDLVDYKEQLLANDKPLCHLERVRLDLANQAERRDLFGRLAGECRNALIISEGLLVYLPPLEVGKLADDLASTAHFDGWVMDLVSPGLLAILARRLGPHLSGSGARFQFGPAEGPAFFEPHGWKPAEIHSMLRTAARAKRLPPLMRLISLLPERPVGDFGSRPWSGVVLFQRT